MSSKLPWRRATASAIKKSRIPQVDNPRDARALRVAVIRKASPEAKIVVVAAADVIRRARDRSRRQRRARLIRLKFKLLFRFRFRAKVAVKPRLKALLRKNHSAASPSGHRNQRQPEFQVTPVCEAERLACKVIENLV